MSRPVAPSSGRLAQLVLESATDFAIITTDLDGGITSWNPGAVNLLGWSERDAVGRGANMIFTPEDEAHESCRREMETARITGRAENERWHRREDGSRFWASGLIMRLEDESSGAHLGYLKILRDRTAQHEADEALRASEALARSLFESSADCVKILELDGRLSAMNGPGLSVMEIDDFSPFIGQDWKVLWPAESQPDLSRALDEARAGGVGRFYGRCPTAKGTLKWWDVQVSPVLGFDGRPAKLLVVSRDVTERASADEALRDSEVRILDLAAQQTATLSQLAEGVVVTDAAGRITLVNDAAARIHGVARLDVAPDDYTQTYSLLTEDGRPYPSLDLPLARAVRGETVMDARWRIRRPDGDEVLAVGNARPVRDAAGRQIGAVLTLRDDTARVAVETALRESEARLRTLTDNLPSGMVYQIAMNRDGSERRFLYVSQSHARLTGVPAEAAMADPSVPYNLILPEHRAALAAAEAVAIRDLSAFDVEAPFRRADTGEVRWSRLVSAPREMPDGSLIWDGIQIDVTDRKAVEVELRDSEARFRNMADHAPVMMWVTDPSGYCTYLNRRWYEFTGQTEEEAQGLGWTKATHPDHQQMAEDAFLSANARQVPFRVEYRLRRADGAYRWAIDAASPRFGPDGEFLGYVGSVIDIDERREVEEALRQREAALRELNADLERQVIERARERGRTWQVSPDMLSVINMNGIFERTNPAWAAALGWSEEELSGVAYSTLVHPEDVERSYAALDDIKRGSPVLRFENRYRRKEGGYRWLAWVAVPESGKLYSSARDVTMEKEQAAALAESTRERDQLWQLSEDLLVTADYEGSLLRVSPSWTRLFGHSETTLLTRPYSEIVHPDDIAPVVEALRRMREDDHPVRFENRVLADDGSYRWISWTLSPEPGGVRLNGVGRDVTQEKERADALARTEEQLRQAQKMEAVGQLTGGIAHDFNNLLTGIIGSLDLMQRRISQGRTGDIERYATAAITSANRAAALTHRLLAFSRRQPLDPKPVNANRLVTGMEELLRRTIGEATQLEIVTAGGLWQTLCDAHQLESAILNLAINARDAMPAGGKLTVETCNAHLDSAYAAQSRDVRPGQYICICVTDTGAGMSPEVIAKAFEPFFTTKPIGQGTGLGLSMIYGFARQSEGYAKIYSEVGQGTTVKLYLPRYYGESEGADAVSAGLTKEHRAEQGEVVLVVEDETAVRDLVVEVLQELGYRPVEAADGLSGLKLLQSEMRIDLLVSDVGLPGLNGRQLADAARELRPGLKILFMTGYAENATVANGFLDPGMEMITKPFAVEALATRIRDMIEAQDRPNRER